LCKTEGWDAGRYFRVDEEAGVLRLSESWAGPDPVVQKFVEKSRDVVFRSGVGLSGVAIGTAGVVRRYQRRSSRPAVRAVTAPYVR
jgi:hypothetical protein